MGITIASRASLPNPKRPARALKGSDTGSAEHGGHSRGSVPFSMTAVSLGKLSSAYFERRLSGAALSFEEFSEIARSEEVLSCDASSYERAAIVHDLNVPPPSSFMSVFDTVIDGDARACVQFPGGDQERDANGEAGGRLFIITPANNYFGTASTSSAGTLLPRAVGGKRYRVGAHDRPCPTMRIFQAIR